MLWKSLLVYLHIFRVQVTKEFVFMWNHLEESKCHTFLFQNILCMCVIKVF